MIRRCHVCQAPISAHHALCKKHWIMVDPDVQRAFFKARQTGDTPKKTLTMSAAMACVALTEGRPLSTRQALAAFDLGIKHERLDPLRIEEARKGPETAIFDEPAKD
jgi:hypothetical protein